MSRIALIIIVVVAIGAAGAAPAAAINQVPPSKCVDESGEWPETTGGVRLFAGPEKTGKGHTLCFPNEGWGRPEGYYDRPGLSSFGLGPAPKGRGVASFRVAVPPACKLVLQMWKPNDKGHRWVFDNRDGYTTMYRWKNLPKTKGERRTKTTWKWGYKLFSGGWVWGYWKSTKKVWVQAPFRDKVSELQAEVGCDAPLDVWDDWHGWGWRPE